MKKILVFVFFLLFAGYAHGAELTELEKRGLYLCSVRGVLEEAVNDNHGAYIVIFRDNLPMVFLEKELSFELKIKLERLPRGEIVKILCIHPAYREDWQEVYDRDGHVWPKLLDATH